MRRNATHFSGFILFNLMLAFTSPASAGECANPEHAMGVARTVEIDTKAGPIFGAYTKQDHEPSFLRPKEIVLTFDDGPMPWITKSILDTLDKFCTKATFFSVGKMALAYPDSVKDVLARGHTLGSHTFTHPYNLGRMTPERAKDEIERGLAAVATAAGVPIAPFFRFPGLADSADLLGYLQTRGIATFTVDAVSNDSYISDEQRLIDHTLKEIGEAKGGIILFHDIKPATARALPQILTALKIRGYSVVHMTSRGAAVPLSTLMSELAPKVANAPHVATAKDSLPLHGAIEPESVASVGALEVTSIVPEPRDRTSPVKSSPPKTEAGKDQLVPKTTRAVVHTSKPPAAAIVSGWSAHVDEIETDIAPPVFVDTDLPESTWDTEVKALARTPIKVRRAAK